MCFGGRQQAVQPQIIYQGPSQADIDANRASLEQYRTLMGEQQSVFQKQLQAQIDAAAKDTEDLRAQLSQELAAVQSQASGATAAAKGQAASDIAAAGAAGAMQQVGAYSVGATESSPEMAQTTAAVAKKEKPVKSLKISTAALPSSSGAGLNIGV